MSKKDKKQRSIHLDKVWCYDCQDKEPMVISTAVKLIPVCEKLYDVKLVGVCQSCLNKRGLFYQNNSEPVDRDNPRLLYKPV